MDWIFVPMTFSTLALYFAGFLAISVAASEKLGRKFGLFIMSIIALASLILVLVHTSYLLSDSKYVRTWGDFDDVSHNDSHMCIDSGSRDVWEYRNCNFTENCIETPKVCDGILDLLADYNSTVINVPGCDFNPSLTIKYFVDELFCGQKYEGVYAMIFGAGAIGILCCLAIWIMSYNTLVLVFKLIRNGIRQIFCAQIPLQ